MERVYDLGKHFRNEGISPKHSPEFTMIEWSMTYCDYRDAAALMERLVADVAGQVWRTLQFSYRGMPISLARPWRQLTFQDAIGEATGLDIFAASPSELMAAAPSTDDSWTGAVHAIYTKHVEPHLIQPTIVRDFPLDTHPCLKQHATRAQLGESFDVVIGGVEVGSGGTELNDPDEQWARFVAQRSERTTGSAPHPQDQEYVTALQYGAPPSAGAGIGIDRLLMVLLNTDSIRDVMLFPTSRQGVA